MVARTKRPRAQKQSKGNTLTPATMRSLNSQSRKLITAFQNWQSTFAKHGICASGRATT